MASIRRTLSPSGHHHTQHQQSRSQSQFQREREREESNPPPFLISITTTAAAAHIGNNNIIQVNQKPYNSKSTPRSNSINNKRNHNHPHYYLFCSDKWKWKWKLKLLFLQMLLFFLLGSFLSFSSFFLTRFRNADDFHPHHFFFDSIRSASNIILYQNNTTDSVDMDIQNNKLLIIVTPTYNRALQAYYLTRLGQTLRLVPPPLLWIVVETNPASLETADLLRRSGVTSYRHLVCDNVSTDVKDRGVHQRNTALQHIERHFLDGIVYFADDDNVYSLQLFDQLRHIRRFGTWPVAMLAQGKNKVTLEGPVCNGSQVIGWHTNEKSKRLRRFHVDMSGFAFNSTILWDPHRWHRPTSDAIRQLDTVKEGFQETTFIELVVEDEHQMEGVTYNCSMIMNWHLHLEAKHLVYPKGWNVSRNLDAVTSLRY